MAADLDARASSSSMEKRLDILFITVQQLVISSKLDRSRIAHVHESAFCAAPGLVGAAAG
jgi:hypothetical protein